MGNKSSTQTTSNAHEVQPQTVLAAMERYAQIPEQELVSEAKKYRFGRKSGRRHQADDSNSTAEASDCVLDLQPQMILRMLEQCASQDDSEKQKYFSAVRAMQEVEDDSSADMDIDIDECVGLAFSRR